MSEILRQQQNKVYRVRQEPLHTRRLATEMPWQVSFASPGIEAYSRPTRCHSSAEVRLPFVAQFTSWRRQQHLLRHTSRHLKRKLLAFRKVRVRLPLLLFWCLASRNYGQTYRTPFSRISRNVSDVEVTNVHVTIGRCVPSKGDTWSCFNLKKKTVTTVNFSKKVTAL